MGSELITTQVTQVGPTPEGIDHGTNLLLPNRQVADRLAHFAEEVYDLSAESHLVRFIKALTGDAGAGQLRKRLLMQRLQQSLQGVHFHDLDRFYGALFGVRRNAAEALTIDPYTSTATTDEWISQQAADASYRSRISQFARALTYGPTPTGIELVAEALLAVDCEVHESYYQADSSYQTYGEIENLDPTVTVWTNLVLNPKPSGLTGWEPSNGATDVLVTDDDGDPCVELIDPVGGGDGYEWVATDPAVTPGIGRWVAFGVDVKPLTEDQASRMRLHVQTRSGSTTVDEQYSPTGAGWTAGQWARQVVSVQQTGAADNVDAIVWPTETPNPGPQFRARRAVVVFADTKEEAEALAAAYWDGDTPDADEKVYAWTGAANASTSTATITGTDYEVLEDKPYSLLEGSALGRLAGDERREFVVRPKRVITQGEAYDLARVLRQIKPADARFIIDHRGVQPHVPIAIRGLLADSDYWEIVPKVATRDVPRSPYAVESGTPVEQPTPPFTGRQGEAWSYIGEVIGVAAFSTTDLNDVPVTEPTQRVTLPDGSTLDYPAAQALTPKRHLLAGRAVSDGVLVAHPYWAMNPRTSPDLAPLFTDRINLEALNGLLSRSPIDTFPQNPVERFWVSRPRPQDDPTIEIVEVSLTQPRRINYLSVETAHYPHTITAQVFQGSEWVTVGTETVRDSNPAYLPPGMQVIGHPQHAHPGHWRKVSFSIDSCLATSIRFLLQRTDGVPPLEAVDKPVDYSLALRSMDIGYRVRSLDDVPAEAQDGTVAIGATTDPVGSTMEFYLRRLSAARLLDDPDAVWKCEPQPVNYAVVNLYLDVRDETGDAQVIDRFFLDPTHPGAHLTIYYTEAVGEPDAQWYAQQTWYPIPRDYRLQKGFVHIPPTAARHFKFEFTALSAEPHESMLALNRPVRLFPQALIEATVHAQGALGSLPGGLRTAIEIGDDRRYADAVAALREAAVDDREYRPTEVLYARDPQTMQALRDQSWAFGWTPWHQGSSAPRWLTAGRHFYDVIEMRHTSKVGFFVGLRDVAAYRTDPGENDDTLVYDEHFHDFRNIQPGFTWTFNPGALETVLETDCVATSRVYASTHDIWAIQFATQQTAPVQIVPDDDLRDPALASIDWTDNPDGWHQVGDALIVYSPINHSARIVRYSQPLLRPTPREGGIVQEPIQEVFSYRPWAIADATQTAASWGGMETPLVGVSATGQVYVAVRLTFLTPQTSPLVLQVLDGTTEDVLGEYEITAVQGEIVERYYPFTLSGSAAIKARIIQRGISDDTWEVDRLSVYDPGIRWEFSVDGGSTWVDAEGVRNNAYGFVTFPEPGNQLMWRVTGMRPRMSLSALRIRVHYLGVQNARYDGVQRGPNVSVYDDVPPVTQDPMFTTWAGPIPRDWFMAYRQFPLLVSADGPTVTEFARFYGRPVDDEIDEPDDVAARLLSARRSAADLAWQDDGSAPTSDAVARQIFAYRTAADDALVVEDAAYVFVLPPDGTIVDRPIQPPL